VQASIQNIARRAAACSVETTPAWHKSAIYNVMAALVCSALYRAFSPSPALSGEPASAPQ